MRIRDWRVVFLFCLFCCVVQFLFGASNNTTPLFPHKDPQDQREFQNVYATMARSPNTYIGSGAPGFTPQKIGDTYIDTATAHVYLSTSTSSSKSWLQTK